MSENLKLPTIQVEFGNVTINAEDCITDFIQGEKKISIYNDKVTEIRAYAFYNFPSSMLTSVEMPNVLEVRPLAFYNCGGVETIKLPSCRALWERAFEYCWRTKNIPDLRNVTLIKSRAFYKSGIDTLVFDKWVVFFEEAFLESSLLHLVLSGDPDCPVLQYKDRMLDGTQIARGHGGIYVRGDKIAEYQKADGWKQFSDRFKARENYTVDGTPEGEIDPVKIGR